MELKTRDKIIVVVLVIVALAVFFGGRYRDNHTHFTTEKWVSAVGNDRQKIVQNLLDRTVFPRHDRSRSEGASGRAGGGSRYLPDLLFGNSSGYLRHICGWGEGISSDFSGCGWQGNCGQRL